MKQLLLVENDSSITQTLSYILTSEGFEVTTVETVRAASQALEKKPFDLILLDLSLPDGDGFELLAKVKDLEKVTPVIIITARLDESIAVKALKMGALDYIRKPFGMKELSVKVQKLFNKNTECHFGDIRLNVEENWATVGGRAMELRKRELQVLAILVRNAEHIVSRDRILQEIDPDAEILDRTIDRILSRLRGKLTAAGGTSISISSVYGLGYKLEKT